MKAMENTLLMYVNDQDTNRRFSMSINNTNKTMINMYRTPRVRLDRIAHARRGRRLKKGADLAQCS